MRARQINSAKDLEVYQMAYDLAMEILETSKSWPRKEKYSLTDQIRRPSRAVCSNLREAWAKRRYQAHFLNKLTDATEKTARQTRGWTLPVNAGGSSRKSTGNWFKNAGQSVPC